jgi:hypothetical protein
MDTWNRPEFGRKWERLERDEENEETMRDEVMKKLISRLIWTAICTTLWSAVEETGVEYMCVCLLIFANNHFNGIDYQCIWRRIFRNRYLVNLLHYLNCITAALIGCVSSDRLLRFHAVQCNIFLLNVSDGHRPVLHIDCSGERFMRSVSPASMY